MRAQQRLLKDTEAADVMSLSVKTLRNWRWRGEGPPFVVVGRRSVRYRQDDIDAYLAAGSRRSTSDHGGSQ